MARGAPGRDEIAAELAILRKLPQQAAAQLVGWTPRGLRDSDAPRNKDGTYNGVRLVKWMLGRAAGAKQKVVLDSKLVDQQLRQEKLREAKRRNDHADGLLIETAKVGEELRSVGKMLLDGINAIARDHPESARKMSALIEEVKNAWELSSSSSSRPSSRSSA